jgi:hypothetical protein
VAYGGLGLEALDAYRASFEINFAGDRGWRYVLETRRDGDALEYRLHLEGVGEAANPGDVRAVTQGDSVRLTGPGTEGECFMFPSDLDVGPTWLTPDDLLRPGLVAPLLERVDDAALGGQPATRAALQADRLGSWTSVQVTVWQATNTSAVLGYDMLMTGPDPFFEAGEGLLAGRFRVEEIGPQPIEPVAGCEIDWPLPAGAARLVRLPGLAAFDSALTPDEVAAFYQDRLPGLGWQPVAEPARAGSALVLSYGQGALEVAINLEATASGTHAELIRGE